MNGQFVIGGSQFLVSGKIMINRTVDQALRMFDADADGKSFGRHRHPAAEEHFKRITRTVADRQHQGGNRLFVYAAAGVADFDSFQTVIVSQQIFQPVLKTVFAAERNNFGTNILHDLRQPIGAEVRLGQIQNLFRRACSRQLAKNFGRVHILFDAGHQFAVGKSTGAAFAELNVGILLQTAAAPETFHVALPLGHRLAAFQHNRPGSRTSQSQSRKHAGRTAADNQRTGRKSRGRRQADTRFRLAFFNKRKPLF